MGFFKNFGKPEGFLGKIMLNGMNHDKPPFYRWGFSHYEWRNDTVVLDIGCGGGMNVKKMLGFAPGIKACGIDISDQAVMKSMIMNRSLIGRRCLIRKGDASSIPFKDGVFDVVTAFETIYFWNDVPAALGEILRVLKPGGTFLVCCKKCDPDATRRKRRSGKTIYTSADLAGLFEEAGFEKTTVDISHKSWCCITGLRPEG